VKSINETHYFGVFLNNVTYTEELYYSFQQWICDRICILTLLC
jgi:hypothetical protein